MPARSVDGSGAGVGGFRSDAGGFKAVDGATPWAAAVGDVAQVLGGVGGMQGLAVVWCQV